MNFTMAIDHFIFTRYWSLHFHLMSIVKCFLFVVTIVRSRGHSMFLWTVQYSRPLLRLLAHFWCQFVFSILTWSCWFYSIFSVLFDNSTLRFSLKFEILIFIPVCSLVFGPELRFYFAWCWLKVTFSHVPGVQTLSIRCFSPYHVELYLPSDFLTLLHTLLCNLYFQVLIY